MATTGFEPVAVTYTSDIAPVSSKEFLDIQAIIESRFTLKRVRDMIITYRNPSKTFDWALNLPLGLHCYPRVSADSKPILIEN